MIVLVLGMALIVIGSLSLQFHDLCRSLKLHDEAQWKLLGSPQGLSFADLGKTIGVYTWVLSGGYENTSKDTQQLGLTALKKALFAKYTLIWGCGFVVLGFGLSLFGL